MFTDDHCKAAAKRAAERFRATDISTPALKGQIMDCFRLTKHVYNVGEHGSSMPTLREIWKKEFEAIGCTEFDFKDEFDLLGAPL